MKVPLKIELQNNKINLVYNKQNHFLDLPILPEMYFENDTYVPNSRSQEVEKIILHDNCKKTLFRKTFNNLNDYHFAKKTFNNEIIYTENYLNQLYLTNLGFGLDVNEPDILFFDIECETMGTKQFPKAETTPILLISTKYNGEIKIFDTYNCTEKEMLISFLRYIKEKNPDILAGYNIIKFDLPYIIKRCISNSVSYNIYLHRDNYSKQIDLERLDFYGRCIYDLFEQCVADNKLRKLNNFKLSTVAKHFKIGQKLEIDFIANLTSTRTDEERKKVFLNYAQTDVELCEKIYQIYYVSKYHLAHMLNVAINDSLNAYPSFIPNLFQGRPLYKANYIPYKFNVNNYSIFLNNLNAGKKLYQGALVDIFKLGLFKKVVHIDYSSMYPNLMIAYNVSPENIKLIKIKDYHNEFIFDKNENELIIEFPDDVLNKNLVVKINLHEGIVTKELKDCYAQRLIYKQKAKESGKTSDVSIENIFKLQLNSTYGYNGAKFARWGSIVGAAFVTAMSRWLLNETIKEVKDIVIEVDTDGLYLSDDIDLNKLNKTMEDKLLATGILKNYLTLDKSYYDGGFFSKAKNYILKKGEKYIFVGSNFTSRRFCKLAVNLQNELITGLFNDIPLSQIYKKYYNFRDKPLSDFSMSIRTRKDLSTYKAKNALAKVLSEQVIAALGGTEFEQIDYVVTKNVQKYTPIELANLSIIDEQYYIKELDKILEKFNLSKNKTLDEWLK